MIFSILKDFLARHVMLIQINNRSRDCNKGERDAGHNRVCVLGFRETRVDTR